MSRTLAIHFIAAASHLVGMGHESRTALLAAACERSGMAVRVTIVDPDSLNADIGWRDIRMTGFDALVIDGPDHFVDACLRHAPSDNLRIAFRMYGVAAETPASVHAFDAVETLEDVAITPSPERSTKVRGHQRLCVEGPQYIFVRRELFAGADHEKVQPPRIVVTFGGADPSDLTSFVADALRGLDPEFRVHLVVGRRNPRFDKIRSQYSERATVHRQGDVRFRTTDFDRLLMGASLAIVNGGLTRYECVAARTPFIGISLNEYQAAFTDKLAARGYGRHVGVAEQVRHQDLCDAVRDVVRLACGRQVMSWSPEDLLFRDADDRFAVELRSWIDQYAKGGVLQS